MKLQDFIADSDLLKQSELTKTELMAFYNLKMNGTNEFDINDVMGWFSELNLPSPNSSRLKKNIEKSRQIIKGTQPKTFRLHANEINKLEASFPSLNIKDEEIECRETILPEELYKDTRGYIVSIAKQINASYENNIFDGCAVLMRRLLEILLIQSYENLGIQDLIKDKNGDYFLLDGIINNAIGNKTLNLSRNAKKNLNGYRELGNFSAHKIYYNCKRNDIDKFIFNYRVDIEELLYKAGILN